MHYSLVIITDEQIKNPKLDTINYIILDETHYLVSDYLLNNNISFDFIIVSNINSLDNIQILKEDGNVICNFFLQTSSEHIFFIGKENNSKLTINEQINNIIDYLTE